MSSQPKRIKALLPSEINDAARSCFAEAKFRAELLYRLECAGDVFRRRLCAEIKRGGGESIIRLIEDARQCRTVK